MAFRRCTAAPAWRAPPPNHSSGRRAAASCSASASSAASAGTGTVMGRGARSRGISTTVCWMSIGISTLTGPVGAVMATCTAFFSVESAVSALRTRNAALDTASSMVS